MPTKWWEADQLAIYKINLRRNNSSLVVRVGLKTCNHNAFPFLPRKGITSL